MPSSDLTILIWSFWNRDLSSLKVLFSLSSIFSEISCKLMGCSARCAKICFFNFADIVIHRI